MPLRHLTFLLLAAAGAALLQSAPSLLPGPGGVLVALAHLPVAAAAAALPRWAPLAGTLAVALVLVLHPQAVAAFILLTGPFGLTLGATTARGWPRGRRLAAGAITLAAGTAALVFGLRQPVPGLVLPPMHTWQELLVYVIAAAAWSGCWVIPVEMLSRWCGQPGRRP